MIYNIKHVREDRIRYVGIQFFLRGIIVFAVGGGGGGGRGVPMPFSVNLLIAFHKFLDPSPSRFVLLGDIIEHYTPDTIINASHSYNIISCIYSIYFKITISP